MRRAQAGERGGQGQAEAGRALDELQQARRLLENRQGGALQRGVNGALQRAERMLDRQRDLSSDVRDAIAANDGSRLAEIRSRKDELAAEVGTLERDLDRMARETRREQPGAARALAEAADSIRSSRLEDKILFSKGLPGRQSPAAIDDFENQITADLEDARDRIAEARDAFRESDPRRLERQLDEARDLVRGLESLQERVRQENDGGGAEGQPGAEDQPGAEGQGAEGQPGAGEGAGEAQGQPAGEPGAQTPGGAGGGAGFGASTGGGGSPMSAEQVRQFQREFARRREEAESLRGELRREGVDVGDLAGAIAALDRLANGAGFDDPEEIERLEDQVLRGLKDFEFTLRRGLTPELERLFLSGSDDVPAEYRELVEEYYRSLSEGR
jgi:hypothetical protein